MIKKKTQKLFSILFAVLFILPFFGFNTVEAANPTSIKAPSGTYTFASQERTAYSGILQNYAGMRAGGHGYIARPGDSISTRSYTLEKNGQFSGSYFYCLEAATEAHRGDVYTVRGVYNGPHAAKVKAYIAWVLNTGDFSRQVLIQSVIWHLIGQVRFTSSEVVAQVNAFNQAYNANPGATMFQGVQLYDMRSSIDGQRGIAISYEKPVDNQNVYITKRPLNKPLTDLAAAGYTLQGAEYGVYRTAADANANRNRIGVFTTAANGVSNTLNVPANTTYYIKEIKAPKGYKLDPNVHTLRVAGAPTSITLNEEPILDPMNITLVNKTNGAGKALQGAEFRVSLYQGLLTTKPTTNPIRSWVFKSDVNGRVFYNPDYLVAGSPALFTNAAGRPNLPIGTTLFVEEVKAPEGHILNSTPGHIQIKEGATGSMEPLQYTPINAVNKPRVLSVIKKDAQTKANVTTGPMEFVVLDAAGKDITTHFIGSNGIYEYNAAPQGTKSLLTRAALGIADLRGIPAGDFTIKEVRAPKGYLLTEETSTVKVLENVEKTLVEVLNEEKPDLSTNAKDTNTGKKLHVPVEDVSITDVVTYTNLVVGEEYTIKGKLMDKATNAPLLVNGNEVTAEKTFTAEVKDGSIELIFTVPSESIRGKTTVVFEDLLKEDKVIATHSDINDLDQTTETVDPSIGTQFMEVGTDAKVVDALEEVKLVDKVEYKNLVPGEEYNLDLVIMDKETAEPLLIDGEEVRGNTTFIPTERDGIAEVEITVNLKDLKGKQLVAFEELTYKGTLLAEHKDINDEGQTVKVVEPGVRTTLMEKDTNNKEVHALTEVVLVDKVELTNVIPGREYTIKGQIVNKENTEVLSTSEIKHVATKENETVYLTFKVNTEKLEGKKIVAFETLEREGVELAVHHDINDENQTVEVVEPNVKTTLIEKDTNNKEVHAEKVKLIDKVEFKNLIIGKEYTIKGEIVDKEEKVLATAEVTFVADEKDGIKDLEFEVDATELKGKEIVAFEDLYHEGVLIKSHRDLEDKDQTVKVVEPKVGTTLMERETNSKTVLAKKEIKLIDKVEYTDLIIGKEYTIKGEVIDKETKKVLSTSELTFVADKKDGFKELEFIVDATELTGKEIVAFEELLQNGKVVAVHKDINDKGQTVNVSHNLEIRIAKADAKNIKFFLAGAEFTVFNQDGTVAKTVEGKDAIGVTDKNGIVTFNILWDKDNKMYVMETKAPRGYQKVNDKFEVKVTEKHTLATELIKMSVLNEAIVIPPATGISENPVLFAGLGVAAVAGLGFLALTKKKKETEEI